MDGVKGVGDLIAEARAHGLTLRVDGERLTVRGPRASRGLARRILERKPEVLRALRGGTADPPSDAAGPPGEGEDPRTAWDRAFEAVARAWDARCARTAGIGDTPPWLDDVTQGHLLGRIHEAIVLGRDAAALEAIGAWLRAWDAVLGSPDGDDDGISSIVPGHRGEGGAGSPTSPGSAVFPRARSAGPPESSLDPPTRAWLERKAAAADAPRLFAWIYDGRRSEDEKTVLRAEVLARADRMIAESEGRRPPPNPGVHRMFADALARFGPFDPGERSITYWLRRHAPKVAALWPGAPADACWLDWREKLPAEHVPALDRALEQAAGARGRDIAGLAAPRRRTR